MPLLETRAFHRVLRAIFCFALILAAALGLYGTRPPAALGPAAALDQFSAARAISYLKQFAERPHPTGTEANDRVRDYLVATLRSLGAEVQIERTTGRHARGPVVREASVQNIVGTVPGRANLRAVMLVAHYDSIPEGPGAADDGAGVSSILEVIRALRAGPPLQNDLIILFTDGEEVGLLGSAGFVADHPDLSSRLGLILNLEARGSSGPALMFETSDQNGWLIPEFARAAPYPMASSLMYSVHKLLPNDTDLTELKATGAPAFNFAFAETSENYHSRLDTWANLDPRSVQHMGMNALALARHFGNLPLTKVRKPDCIYFNWLGQRLVVYPLPVAWMLAAVNFALLLIAFLLGRRRGLMKLSLASVAAFFLLLLFLSGGMLLVWSAIKLLLGGSLLRGDVLSNRFLFVGLVAIDFVVGNSILLWLSTRLGARTLSGGLLLVAALLATTVLYLLPGASYVFQWPALLGAASLLLGLRTPQPMGQACWGLLAALPALLIFAPLAYLFFVGLGLNMASLLASALLLSLLLATAWPVFDFISRACGSVKIFPESPATSNEAR